MIYASETRPPPSRLGQLIDFVSTRLSGRCHEFGDFCENLFYILEVPNLWDGAFFVERVDDFLVRFHHQNSGFHDVRGAVFRQGRDLLDFGGDNQTVAASDYDPHLLQHCVSRSGPDVVFKNRLCNWVQAKYELVLGHVFSIDARVTRADVFSDCFELGLDPDRSQSCARPFGRGDSALVSHRDSERDDSSCERADGSCCIPEQSCVHAFPTANWGRIVA
ncbi:hypothetical protein WS87_08505 [Burkholderia sp. MSMB0856]|nr:hypothetical protein WS87_08505 [Burkholderia sp. MSMB0856]KVH38050.1 hypothetical protein WS87_00115 [Burkholderia sp. MSMB0856]